MRKKHEEKEPNNERWLLTYSDLITLLMIFFIVMYSFSNVDKNKYRQLVYGLNEAFGGKGGKSMVGVDGAVNLDNDWKPTDTNLVEQEEVNKLEGIKKQVDKYLEETGLNGSVITKIDERGLELSFKDSLFFDSGKADIKPDQAKKLADIGKILNLKDISGNYIRVEGHTDNVPISNYLFKSNWDLSCIRASNVVQLLVNQSGIHPQRISALGYGEFRPVADNSTEGGRSRNRRIDIIIVNAKFNQVENNSSN